MHIIIILIIFVYISFSLTNHGFIYRNPTVLFFVGIFLCFMAFWVYRLIGVLKQDQINLLNLGSFIINKEELNALVGLTIGSISAAFITSSLIMRFQKSNSIEMDELVRQKINLEKEMITFDEALSEYNLSELNIPVEISLNIVSYLDKKEQINPDYFKYDDVCKRLIIKNHIQKELDQLNEKIRRYRLVFSFN